MKKAVSLAKQGIGGILCFLCMGMGLLLTGCSFTTRQSALDPKGPVAQGEYDVFMVTVWVTLFIFIIVGSVLLWAVIRFRERKSDEGKPWPDQGHGNPLVEMGLIVAATALLALIAVPTLEMIWFVEDLPENPESALQEWFTGDVSEGEQEKVLEINAIGYQWWWKFEYPQLGVTTANEMILPVSKVVKINLRTADVIHSFWIPKMAGKIDLMPGRNNWMWLQADEEGYYYGQCAEYCGEAHAYMLIRSEVHSNEKFAEWVAHQKTDAPEPAEEDYTIVEGKKLFLEKTCLQCHTIRGYTIDGQRFDGGVRGPELTHIASRTTIAAGMLDNRDEAGTIDPKKQQENLYKWIQESYHVKPGNRMYYGDGALEELKQNGKYMTPEETKKIVSYLQTLN